MSGLPAVPLFCDSGLDLSHDSPQLLHQLFLPNLSSPTLYFNHLFHFCALGLDL